jgi:hypothetical protein
MGTTNKFLVWFSILLAAFLLYGWSPEFWQGLFH